MSTEITDPFVFEPVCPVWAAGVETSDLPRGELPRYEEGFPA
jgi:hypothetical protein